MAKKLKLLIEEDDLLPELVLGIHSHARDYKLIWAINKQTQLGLQKKEHSIALLSESKHSTFGTPDGIITLIKNQQQNSYFVPENKNLDYLMVIQDDIEKEKLINKLNSVKEILLVNELDLSKLKSQVNFEF